jgi:hypothetical protein
MLFFKKKKEPSKEELRANEMEEKKRLLYYGIDSSRHILDMTREMDDIYSRAERLNRESR